MVLMTMAARTHLHCSPIIIEKAPRALGTIVTIVICT